ncbi:hypothetical protein ACTFIU_009312 [Dictyostelium citrinum]
MNSLIELKEEVLKSEKEYEEKLKKEGYKQLSKGEGYMVLSNACEPSSSSFSVSLTNNEDKRFNFEDAKIATSNFVIDRNILMKNPPDPLVFIKMPSSKIIKTSVLLNVAYNGIPFPMFFECTVIPCAAFMRYIKAYPVVGTVETSLEKRKGFTRRFNASIQVRSGVSLGIFGCEASLEVTTDFQYEHTINEEVTQTWKQTLSEGTYLVYQNVLVYAFIFPKTYPDRIIELINEYNPGVTFNYIPTLNASVMFVPLNRNDPFTLRYEDHVWEPVEYDNLVDYLVKNPSKWRS